MMDTQPPAPAIEARAVEGPAGLFRVLGHETRLRLLLLLAAGELSVGALEKASGVGQPGLSQQLAILRKAQLVVTRRAAKQIYYRVDPAAVKPAADMLALLTNLPVAPMRADRKRGDEPQRGTARSAAGFAKML